MARVRPVPALASLILLISCTTAQAGPRSGGQDGLVHGEIASDGTSRTYEMHRPEGLKGPAPLVIMLHGGGGNAENGARMSGFNALADREGFTVVYPDGSGRTRLLTWNAVHCCAYAMREDVDDVRFLSDLIDDLVARGIADRNRVYVTGMSNGAMMTHRAGRELSGKVAAIAPVVGAVFGDEPLSPGPVPTLIITGAKDTHVPAAGGNGEFPKLAGGPPNDLPFAPAVDGFRYWLKSNHCSGEAPVSASPGVYTLREGAGCAAPVKWYAISEGGHAWPGGRKGSRRGDDPVPDFDASEVIWNFFERQTLKGR